MLTHFKGIGKGQDPHGGLVDFQNLSLRNNEDGRTPSAAASDVYMPQYLAQHNQQPFSGKQWIENEKTRQILLTARKKLYELLMRLYRMNICVVHVCVFVCMFVFESVSVCVCV